MPPVGRTAHGVRPGGSPPAVARPAPGVPVVVHPAATVAPTGARIPPGVALTPRPALPPHATVGLHYREHSPIRVRGPVTGRTYEFSAAAPDQPVDVRDADALCRTRFFRRR